MNKKGFIQQAVAYGVSANYSGGTQTMFITGEDEKVKSFIRVVNLKGKKAIPYSVKQS